ncbi:MAG TPA: hypothetical protein VNH18_03520 [Bryobacteraceae bacterium]|jgi:hypothetical protein|nr:hypothetical protein [Bryobacteraceae bacterium]
MKQITPLISVVPILVMIALFHRIEAQSVTEPELTLDTTIVQFEATGTFEDVLGKLAVELRPTVLFGFLKAQGTSPKIRVSVDNSRIIDVLERMCVQDPRYQVAPSATRHVVNVLPRSRDARGMDLLRIHLNRFDMVTEDWPQNLHMRAIEFSPEIGAYLQKWYRMESKPKAPIGSPGVNMMSTVAPPRVEVHLENASVLEIMNAISEWTLQLSVARDNSVPKVVTIWPVGWQGEVPRTDETTFEYWSHAIFSSFPR